jgi:ABC-2 type transport system ATP-binding protein
MPGGIFEAAMEPILEVRNLRKEFEHFTLKDVSFSMPRGYIMGVIGPNGAGKTTIIKLILNLLPRKSGEIRLFGLDSLRYESEVKSRVGFVHDEPSFYGYLKLKTIKNIYARFYRSWDDGLFYRLCREFELAPDKKFSTLSRGMKMKFALALALAHDAEFIILDEPTSGLDPVFRRELLERLSRIIQDERKAVLFSSHITSDLERIVDFITFVREGEVLFSTTREEILDNWAVVKGGTGLLTAEVKRLFRVIRTGAYGFKALTSDVGHARRELAGREAVFEKATLDDIVFFLSREGKDA